MTLKIGASGLASFRSWLGDHGLSEGTIGVYSNDIEKAVAAGGFLERLRDDDLAPKTRRHILAAARRWAEFTDDETLTKQLKKLRLPPPRRRAAKLPIERAQFFDVIDALDDKKPRRAAREELDEVMRAVLGMMACRGLRCGDVLRLRRAELEAAKEGGTLSFEAKGRRRLEFKVLKTWRRWIVILADQDGKWDRVDELVSPYAGKKGRRSAAARAVERALTTLGVRLGILGLHPHRLRRTYAVEYLRAMQGDPEALVKLTQHMQWASMVTAMEYVDHARGAELDTVAERIFER